MGEEEGAADDDDEERWLRNNKRLGFAIKVVRWVDRGETKQHFLWGAEVNMQMATDRR